MSTIQLKTTNLDKQPLFCTKLPEKKKSLQEHVPQNHMYILQYLGKSSTRKKKLSKSPSRHWIVCDLNTTNEVAV